MRWIWKLLPGLLLLLGLAACTGNDLPAATPAGFVTPQVSAAPSAVPPTPRSQNSSPSPAPTLGLQPSVTPTFTLQPPTPPACAPGVIESRQLASEHLKDPLKYLVYLPPCYDQNDQRYPVIYLLHGQTYSNTHWLDLGAAETADRLISGGEVAPFIMVFPYDARHFDPPPVSGFDEAFLGDLLPAVDGEYRTRPERACRAIGGISRGGNWAVHIGLQHPDLFGAIGAHSTPVFSTDSNKEIREWLAAIPDDEFPRLYLDAGTNDRWLRYTLVFENLLSEANVPYEWHLYPGFHDDAYWQAHLEEYLRWYAQAW